MRKCIGCNNSFPQDTLQRFVERDGDIQPDIEFKQDGRGFYLCKDQECLKKAIKNKAFNRVCKKQIKLEEEILSRCLN